MDDVLVGIDTAIPCGVIVNELVTKSLERAFTHGRPGEMDGIEAAAKIRDQFDIPVVFLTTSADEAILELGKLTEPFGFLLKPMDPRVLQSAVEVTIYKHQIETRLKENERWLASVLQSTSDAMVITARHGVINLFNPSAEALFGSNGSERIKSERDLAEALKQVRPQGEIQRLNEFTNRILDSNPSALAVLRGIRREVILVNRAFCESFSLD